MARYPDELINEIIYANDIVDIVSKYVKLKRSGSTLVGLCPFHNEKTPSFHVDGDKQLFHCFGCGEGGSVIQFVEKMENLDFVETIKLLADRAKISLPEDNDSSSEIYDKKQRFYKMNADAARFFFNCLTKTPEGKDALSYLVKRSMSKKTIVSFGIGFAPDSFDALKTHLTSLGYTEEEILEAGLASSSKNKIYDKFRNRIMFPIFDLRNNLIAFGGRVMDDSMPKYLNSPETLVFSKSNNLFALNIAKNSKNTGDKIILVEGYMDVITLHQHGVTNAVATLGTALTSQQVRLLKNYCKELVLCYDTDSAGRKATLRAIELTNEAGVKTKVMNLPDAKDPDEFLKKYNVDIFRKYVDNAAPSTQYRIDIEKEKYDLSNLEDKIEFVNATAQILASVDDSVEVDAYARDISEKEDIKTDSLYASIKKYKGQNKRYGRSEQKSSTNNVASDANSANMAITSRMVKDSRKSLAEANLINLLVKSKKVYESIKDSLSPDDFDDSIHRTLAQKIFDAYEQDKPVNPSSLITGLPENDTKDASEILFKEIMCSDIVYTAQDLVKTIKLEAVNNEIKTTKDAQRLKLLLDKKRQLEKK